MKGVSHTLWIVVAAVVILVVALVIVTIFGGGITRFSSITEAKNYCMLVGQPVCAMGGPEPVGWSDANMKVGTEDKSCKIVCGIWSSVCVNKRFTCGGGQVTI